MVDFFINAFNIVLYQPLFNVLIFLYQYLPGNDFGVAVIVLTLTIRIILYPLTFKSVKIQKKFSEIQPKIKEIQKKYEKNKEEQAKKVMELYKNERVNPLGGCLPMLFQFPILIALFWVFRNGLEPGEMNLLYSFMPSPGLIDSSFFGLVNLSEASILLALLAGFSQFFQTKMLLPKQKKKSEKSDQMAQVSEIMQKQMVYILPIMTFLILCRLPAAIGLYWLTTALFSIFQQKIIFAKKQKS